MSQRTHRCDLRGAPGDTEAAARVFDAVGVCTEGRCVYGDTRTDCAENGQICEEAACVDPPDPCERGLLLPPTERCVGSIAVVYTEGVCVGLLPLRRHADRLLEQGLVCVGGARRGGPLRGRHLRLRPPECEAMCSSSARMDCVDGFPHHDEGACAAPPTGSCALRAHASRTRPAGVTCRRRRLPIAKASSSMPSRRLAGTPTTTRRRRGAPSTRSPCRTAPSDQLCRDGACVDASPCEGECLSPPGARCEGDTLVVSDVPGVCSDDTGACSYGRPARTAPSAGKIFDGECLDDDGCVGVLCNAPPRPSAPGT